MEISRLTLLGLQLVQLIDAGRGNDITIEQAVDSVDRISGLLLEKFPRLAIEPDLAVFLNEECVGHHSSNPPGIFGAQNQGLCLVLGWILESIRNLTEAAETD
jgi:hypothetical protein